MIGFRNRENTNFFDLFLNNERVADCYAERQYHESRGWIVVIWIKNRVAGEKIIGASKDFPSNTGFVIENWLKLGQAEVDLHCGDYQREGLFSEGFFKIKYNLDKWGFPFDFEQYFVEFSRIFGTDVFALNLKSNSANNINIEIRYFIQPKIKGLFHVEKVDLPSEITNLTNLLNQYHEEAISRLLKIHNEEILAVFDFPEELKTACEQYLIYFSQFLRDLGVNATSELREEGGKILVSVTPKDSEDDILAKIHEAFRYFLKLPSIRLNFDSQEIAIQRLESQVEYFRSQIRLARAELQLKAATIQQQQVTIMKLGENVMIDSMVKPVSENKTSEKVVKGVEIGKIEELEKYGVSIDLGELFRTIKGWFKKKS